MGVKVESLVHVKMLFIKTMQMSQMSICHAYKSKKTTHAVGTFDWFHS